jgi:hypothetical protein
MTTMPDRTCHMGGMTRTNIWIWDCVNGQHVTIHQFDTDMKTYPAIIEKTKCGKQTGIEKENYLEYNFEDKCEEAPEWKVKP